ncbi:hypothetical protein SDC9_169473 [bioreactor metagenome]|uniref:Uncharacterized protein n=1 Tax=bioreactor metagenome TaxID=1076179 RepID=A0A645G7X5_9ZZZZ
MQVVVTDMAAAQQFFVHKRPERRRLPLRRAEVCLYGDVRGQHKRVGIAVCLNAAATRLRDFQVRQKGEAIQNLRKHRMAGFTAARERHMDAQTDNQPRLAAVFVVFEHIRTVNGKRVLNAYRLHTDGNGDGIERYRLR